MNREQISRSITGALEHLEKDYKGQYKTSTTNFARSYMRLLLPYAITEEFDTDKKEKIYVVLNREYKPLGLGKGEYIRYTDYPCKINRSLYEELQIKLKTNTENTRLITLYHDGITPWSTKKNLHKYIEQLNKLTSILKQ